MIYEIWPMRIKDGLRTAEEEEEEEEEGETITTVVEVAVTAQAETTEEGEMEEAMDNNETHDEMTIIEEPTTITIHRRQEIMIRTLPEAMIEGMITILVVITITTIDDKEVNRLSEGVVEEIKVLILNYENEKLDKIKSI
jgi:hypothetical protein